MWLPVNTLKYWFLTGPTLGKYGANRPMDVTRTVGFSAGSFQYNPSTGHFWQPVTVTNNGATLNAPLSLVLPNLSSNAVLWNNSGATTLPMTTGGPIAAPYLNAPLTGPLLHGQNVTFHIVFIDAADQESKVAHITYSAPHFLAGLGVR